MDNNGVKLLGFWASPFVYRVKWALKLKGINYEYIEENVFNKSPLLLKLNPVHGKVPVLVHAGKSFSESLVILEYVDEMWKNTPLLPEDPLERADARFWAKFSEEKVFSAAWLSLCSEGERQEKAVKSAIEALEKIEEKIKGKKFFGGDKIGYLDLIIGFVSYLVPVWEEVASFKILDHSKFPGIIAWTKDFLEHSVIKGEDLPSKDEMLTFFNFQRRNLMPYYASIDA